MQIVTRIQEEAPRHGLDADSVITRLMYGVGTNLITSMGDPALDGVYKLVAVKEGGKWIPALKLSENRDKIPNPGEKKVWRIYDRKEKAVADLIGTAEEDISGLEKIQLRHTCDPKKSRIVSESEISSMEPLHTTVIRKGKIVYDFPSVAEIRKNRDRDMERLDAGVKRIVDPDRYHVSLTPKLWKLKTDLIKKSH